MSRADMMNIITRKTTKAETTKAYKDYPDTNPKGIEPFHYSTVEPIFCEIRPKSRVLDVGCNTGEMMKLLRDAKQCDVVGIDLSTKALALARKKGLKVKCASAEKLPFMDETFDAVVLREVLVHIHEPVKALKEIRRVLKPHGVLLGSTPHANLERLIWDDKRLHHRYYDEEKLMEDVKKAFDVAHLRVLNGAQFAISFAQSMLADQPAEILFKCGGEKTTPWDHDLISDEKTLRVWMGPTMPVGDAYYRLIGYGNKMRKMRGIEVAFEEFDWKSNDACTLWQRKMLMSPDGQVTSAVALDHFEKCLKIANPWIFQVTTYEDILMLFEAMKEAYPMKKLITEVDDWLFDIPAYNVASHPFRPNSPSERIALEQLKLSDALIVSTSFLKENLGRMLPSKPIHLIPNSIDFDLWEKAKGDGGLDRKKEGGVRIGYTGCANHSGDMEIVKPVLLALLDEYPNLEVIIAQDFGCFKDVIHPRLRTLNRWADILSYPAMVKGWGLDIGIAPLRDNDFNRAKSNLRWLEYSSLSVPSVVSNVRPFAESVSHAQDGFLCNTKTEWYETLKNLIERPDLRFGIGRSAYLAVKERFNMDTWAKKYAEVLKEIKA